MMNLLQTEYSSIRPSVMRCCYSVRIVIITNCVTNPYLTCIMTEYQLPDDIFWSHFSVLTILTSKQTNRTENEPCVSEFVFILRCCLNDAAHEFKERPCRPNVKWKKWQGITHNLFQENHLVQACDRGKPWHSCHTSRFETAASRL